MVKEIQDSTGCCRKHPQSRLSEAGEVEDDRCQANFVRGIHHVAEISGVSRISYLKKGDTV